MAPAPPAASAPDRQTDIASTWSGNPPEAKTMALKVVIRSSITISALVKARKSISRFPNDPLYHGVLTFLELELFFMC